MLAAVVVSQLFEAREMHEFNAVGQMPQQTSCFHRANIHTMQHN